MARYKRKTQYIYDYPYWQPGDPTPLEMEERIQEIRSRPTPDCLQKNLSAKEDDISIERLMKYPIKNGSETIPDLVGLAIFQSLGAGKWRRGRTQHKD